MRRTTVRMVVVLILALGLGGCQTAATDLSSDRADQFQARVLAITTSVAQGAFADALDSVAALEAELDAAAADGSVSFSRHQRIEAALTAVRSDVQAAIDAQAPPAQPAEPAEPVAPADPVVPPEDDEGGNGDEGQDKGNGNDDKGNEDDKKGDD